MHHREVVGIVSDLYLLKRQLEFVQKQLNVQEIPIRYALEMLEKQYDLGDDDEWGEYMAYRDGHEHEIAARLPRMIVNPFIISAWSVYEASISSLADSMRKRRGAVKKLDDIRGRHFTLRARKYFKQVIKLEFVTHRYRVDDLKHLAMIRNAIAHYNGRLVGVKHGGLREAIENRQFEGITIDPFGEYLVIGYTFAERMMRAVESHLQDLIDQYEQVTSVSREP